MKFLESDLGQIILVTLAHSWAPTQEARKKTFFFFKAPGLYFLKYSVLKPIGGQNLAVCY